MGRVKRAFVLVGVGRTGRLPILPAVDAGLAAVRGWIAEQGVPDEFVTCLDDSDGKTVEVSQVFQAIKAYSDSRVVEQLVVYFCGHGVVNDGSELWLLSGAPDDPSAAVNVAKSVRLAERGVIPHVVLLSDACRSQAASLQFGEVTGSSVFPNPNTVGSRKVDVFYATRVGENAHQVADEEANAAVGAAAKAFHPVWTEVVAAALRGSYPQEQVQREAVQLGGSEVDVVRPWSLHQALPTLLSERLNALGVLAQVTQFPDSRITSDPRSVWLSQLPHAGPQPSGAVAPSPAAPPPPAAAPAPSAAPPPASAPRRYRGRKRLRLPWHSDEKPAPPPAPSVPPPRPPSRPTGPRPTVMVDEARVTASRAESDLVTAARVASQEPLTVVAVGNGADSNERRPEPALEPRACTLLTHTGGAMLATTGDLVLLLPDFGGLPCTVLMDGSGVVDVRWRSLTQAADVDVAWRSMVASRTRFGLPWLEDPSDAIQRAVQVSEADPSVGVYVAYGLAEAGFRSHVAILLDRLRAQGSPVPYDVALLAEDLGHHDGPPIPLLTGGWSLLGDDGVAPMPALPGRHPSLWTAFRLGSADPLEHFLADSHP